jgi:hypothetical protein
MSRICIVAQFFWHGKHTFFARTGAFLREWALAARFAASMKFTRLQPEARAIGGRMAAKAPVQNQPSERPFCYQVE